MSGLLTLMFGQSALNLDRAPDRRRAEAAGFRGFLLKPVHVGELEKFIASAP
jgi:DNA-binding NarL/FixJ family response regulator